MCSASRRSNNVGRWLSPVTFLPLSLSCSAFGTSPSMGQHAKIMVERVDGGDHGALERECPRIVPLLACRWLLPGEKNEISGADRLGLLQRLQTHDQRME